MLIQSNLCLECRRGTQLPVIATIGLTAALLTACPGVNLAPGFKRQAEERKRTQATAGTSAPPTISGDVRARLLACVSLRRLCLPAVWVCVVLLKGRGGSERALQPTSTSPLSYT